MVDIVDDRDDDKEGSWTLKVGNDGLVVLMCDDYYDD